MHSTIAWLDHSDTQRRRMMEVVGLFREKTTVDDLGIGSVRDTFSELLFPGTSTLHTRAKYLLFLPWICLRLEADGTPSRRGWDKLRKSETRLIYALLSGGEGQGVIGADARENLKQWPSFMYWNALGRHGIRLAPLSRGQYIASLDGFHHARRSVQRTDDGDPVSGTPAAWHAELPTEEDSFLDETTFALSPDQGSYLTDRVLASAPTSYFAHLLQAEPIDDVATPWAHPAAPTAPPATRELVDHARRFSQLIHGASLLYNLLLAEAVREARTAGGTVAVDEDLVDDYRDGLTEWADQTRSQDADLVRWDRTRFWQVVTAGNNRIPARTQRFIDWWLELATTGDPHELIDDPTVREQLRRREFQNKGKLARLRNPRALERWTGASATSQLTFRWPNVLTMINEIVHGREGQHARA